MSKGLRFASIDALPPGLREQARKRFEGIRAPIDPLSQVALRQPEEEARNRAASTLVHNLGDNPRVIHGVDYGSPDGDMTVHGVVRDGVTTLTSVTTQRRNKYGAVATTVNGIRFDSKREARYYEQLCLRVAAGEVRYFLRQVPLHLPGGTRLVVDFLEVHADGTLHYVDAKGRETPTFKIKRREIQAHYPITIELV